jgi:hypothetical protein
MHCVHVTYRVTGLPDEELREAFAAAIPALQAVPGLGLKLWLADSDDRSVGGVYVFQSEEAADDYLDSGLFAEGVRDNPYLVDVEIRRHGVLEGPTSATSPWVRLPAARNTTAAGASR